MVCGICVLLISPLTYSYLPDYFGIDGHVLTTEFRNNYGQNILKRDMIGASPFIGIDLNERFSVEGGYQYLKNSRVSTLESGHIAAGMPVPSALAPATFKSWAIFKGPHVSLLVKTPVHQCVPIQFFGGAGVSRIEANFYRKTLQLGCVVGSVTRRIHISKTLIKLTLGANCFLSENFALRGQVNFMNTKKLKAFSKDNVCNYLFVPEIRPKNSIFYSIGLRWSF